MKPEMKLVRLSEVFSIGVQASRLQSGLSVSELSFYIS